MSTNYTIFFIRNFEFCGFFKCIFFRLTSDEQENIGIMCKRLIDYGRVQYIEKQGLKASLVKYTSRDITPENIALVVST